MGNTSSTHNCNVVFLGLDGSGKTSILARLSGDDPRTVLPTLGFNIRAFSLENAPLLKVWDQGGTPSMRRYWPAYYAKAHAIAFVIDSSDHRRLGECSRVMQEVLDDELAQSVRTTIRQNATPRHVPAKIIQVPEIPRTLSGKIVELAVREVVHGRPVNNVDALANPEALEHFADLAELTR